MNIPEIEREAERYTIKDLSAMTMYPHDLHDPLFRQVTIAQHLKGNGKMTEREHLAFLAHIYDMQVKRLDPVKVEINTWIRNGTPVTEIVSRLNNNIRLFTNILDALAKNFWYETIPVFLKTEVRREDIVRYLESNGIYL